MYNELSKVIVEMSINDTSAADIEISGFLSECAVATSLINNYMKQMFLLEYTDVPLTKFGYVQEASVSEVKDKIKTAASGAATSILNFLKTIGTLILNFFNWLFGKNKLDRLINKVDSMSGITVMDVDRDSIVKCFGGLLATFSIYGEFADLVTSMSTNSYSYIILDRELDTLISVGTSKNPSEQMLYMFNDIISSSKYKDFRDIFKHLMKTVESAKKSAAETGSNRQADDKMIISAVLMIVKKVDPMEKASKILKSLNVNIDNFSEKLTGEPKLVEIINGITKKLNRCYGIYQKKCVSCIASLVKATEKENKKGTPGSAKKSATPYDNKYFDDDDSFDYFDSENVRYLGSAVKATATEKENKKELLDSRRNQPKLTQKNQPMLTQKNQPMLPQKTSYIDPENIRYLR